MENEAADTNQAHAVWEISREFFSSFQIPNDVRVLAMMNPMANVKKIIIRNVSKLVSTVFVMQDPEAT